MVGNNTPVFFMRDPLKFQHFIRSQKRLQASNVRDHNMQWDLWSLVPESAHQVTWLMGDRGIPKSWRQMNGYSMSPKVLKSRCCHGCSSTGATSTPISERRSREASGELSWGFAADRRPGMIEACGSAPWR